MVPTNVPSGWALGVGNGTPPTQEALLSRLLRLLTSEGFTPDSQIVCSAVAQPLGEALSTVFEPIGLAWRAAHADSIQIITLAEAKQRLDIEFYPIAHAPEATFDPKPLLEEIRGSIGTDSWKGTGGAGIVVYDAAAAHLIVLQTQPVQEQIERWVKQRLTAENAP